jgi:hypothetical protein
MLFHKFLDLIGNVRQIELTLYGVVRTYAGVPDRGRPEQYRLFRDRGL